MFGIGSTELLVIILVALVVLGPKSLTGITRSLGKAVGEFRRVSTEFQRTLNAEVDQAAEEDRKKAAETAAPAATAEAQPPRQAAPAETAQEKAQPAKTQPVATAQATQAAQPAAQQAAPQEASASMPTFDAVPQPPAPPADSPLAQALAKTRAEAEGAPASPTSKPTGGAA